MINWKKLLETSLSVGVAIAASVIGDKFVAKAAKTITTKDDDNNDKPNDNAEVEEETDEEKEDED